MLKSFAISTCTSHTFAKEMTLPIAGQVTYKSTLTLLYRVRLLMGTDLAYKKAGCWLI